MSGKVAAALAFAATVSGQAVDCTTQSLQNKDDCTAAADMCAWTATTCKLISDGTATDDAACEARIDSNEDQATCEGAADSETGCIWDSTGADAAAKCKLAKESDCAAAAACDGEAPIGACKEDVAGTCDFLNCALVATASATEAQCTANGCLFTAAVVADADAGRDAADAACTACAEQVNDGCGEGCEVDGDTACKLTVAEDPAEAASVDLSGLTDCAAISTEDACTDACTWASDACGYKACADLDATADDCAPAYCKFTAAVDAVEATTDGAGAVEAADASCATVASADAGCADLTEAQCTVAAAAASVCEWAADADTPECKAVVAETDSTDDDADSGSDDAGAEGFRTMALIPLVSAAAALFA